MKQQKDAKLATGKKSSPEQPPMRLVFCAPRFDGKTGGYKMRRAAR